MRFYLAMADNRKSFPYANGGKNSLRSGRKREIICSSIIVMLVCGGGRYHTIDVSIQNDKERIL